MPSGGRHENMRTYTADEAAFVHELVEQFAPQWTLIAKKVSVAFGITRTAASVRNYYKRFLASKAVADRGEAKNKCQLCGQTKRGHLCTPMQTAQQPRVIGWCKDQPAISPADAPGSRPLTFGSLGLSNMIDASSLALSLAEPSPVTLNTPPLASFLQEGYTPPNYDPQNPFAFASAAPAVAPVLPVLAASVVAEPAAAPAPALPTKPAATPVVVEQATAPYSPLAITDGLLNATKPPPAISIDEMMAEKLFRREERSSVSGLLELSTSPRHSFSNLHSPEDTAISA